MNHWATLRPWIGGRLRAGPGGPAGGHLAYPKFLEMTTLKYDPLQNTNTTFIPDLILSDG